MAAAFLTQVFHDIPHFSFTFKRVYEPFTLQLDSSYVQSLLLFVVLSVFVGGLLLLTIIITWICQCCSRQNASVKSRRRVHQLSTLLFIISIFCFFSLGVCLFGNEHLNRGVTSSVTGIDDVIHNFRHAVSQCSTMNETRLSTTRHVESLSIAIRKEADRTHDINTTMLNEAEADINLLNERMESIGAYLVELKSALLGVAFLEQTRLYSERVELERWILCVTLLSIMLIVLFAGVISFCRQSKKGAVVFSGLGFAIFIVGWLLLAAVFPLTVSLADFCANGGPFIRRHLANETVQALDFYRGCDPRPTHDNVPGVLSVSKISDELSKLQNTEQNLDLLIGKLFAQKTELVNETRLISEDISKSMKTIGALETTLSCYTYRTDMALMERGLCEDGIIGASILTFCLFLLGVLMFGLLLIVSKSWHLFTQLPSDYVEVDDEDPFFPRGNDSTIPVDIYGTHVYNPRTRFANSLDRTEPSTGTTTATGALANGSANHPSASTALLEPSDSSALFWQRSTAPPTTTAVVNSTPPAVGTNRFIA